MIDKLDRWNPTVYAENSDFQYESAIALLKQLPIKSNQKILEIGCGPGRITAALAKRVYNGILTGIDSSGKMIQYAKKHYSTIGNLNFFEMNAEVLQFGDRELKKKYYDWVISFWTLSWIKQHEKVISGIVQCLAKKGNIFLLIPFNNTVLEDTFFELQKKKQWEHYFVNYQAPKNNFCSNGYRGLIERYGFTKVTCKSKKIIKEFPDRESLTKFVRSWLPYLDPIPNLVQDSFLNEFIESYLNRSYQDKNIVGFDVFIVRASCF